MTGFAFEVLFSWTTPTILGIISPPFSTITVSFSCKSIFLIWSELCNEALLTIVPFNRTGCKFATGVIAPVLPTCKSILLTTDFTAREGNYLPENNVFVGSD